MKKKIKVIGGVICAAAVLASMPFVLYLKVLPDTVSNPKCIKFVENKVKSFTNIDIDIKNPVLTTAFSPIFAFKTDEIAIS